jgi:hypothetical protein
MESISASSILSLCPENSGQRDTFIQSVVEPIENGFEDALDVLIKIKHWQKTFEQIIPLIESKAISEAEKFGEKTFQKLGFEITIKEVGTKWNFEKTNDKALFRFHESSEKLKNEIKEREAFLKTLKQKTTFVDEETGEVLEIFPPYKISKTGLSFSLL